MEFALSAFEGEASWTFLIRDLSSGSHREGRASVGAPAASFVAEDWFLLLIEEKVLTGVAKRLSRTGT